MFYIYIIYSESADRYYIGHTDDPARRLEQHNTVIKNSYTFKFRPWIMKACFGISESRGEARKVEIYLKRKLIENLILYPEEFDKIMKLVRAGAVEKAIQTLFLPLCSFVRYFVILCV
jgi:putative endonuclease